MQTYLSRAATMLMVILPVGVSALEVAQIDVEIISIQKDFNVQVHYPYDRDLFFPTAWKTPSNEMLAKQIELAEVARLLPIIRDFLSDHPLSVIHSDLDHIYLLAELSFRGKAYGSTYEKKSIYLVCKGIEQRYTAEFLEQRLHSEFSSILLRRHSFPARQWSQINPPGFSYSGNGFEVVNHPSRYDFSERAHSEGFLLVYSQSSLENDFNMMASWLFTKKDALDEISEKHEKMRLKQALAEQFYQSLSDQYRFD